MKNKRNICMKCLMTVCLYLAFFSISALALAEPAPGEIGLKSCEVVVSIKNAGPFVAALMDSGFAREFSASKLGERYAQSSFFTKYSQLKTAFDDTFGSEFKVEKLTEFFNCDCSLFFIRTDWDRPLYLLEVDKSISKYEYFARFKKSLKSEKIGSSTVYFVSTADGIDMAFFTSSGPRTYVSNSIDIIKGVAEGKTAIGERLSTHAPVCAFFNIVKLVTVRLIPAVKNSGGYYAYFFAEKDGTVRMASFAGDDQPALQKVAAAAALVKDVPVPKDSPAFSFAAFGFNTAEYFSSAVREAKRLSAPAGVTGMLERLAAKPASGAFLVAEETAGAKNGVYSAALACDKPTDQEMADFANFLPDMSVKYDSGMLKVSTVAGEKPAVDRFAWVAGEGKTLNVLPKGYYYMINFPQACGVASGVMDAILKLDNWKSSEAYDFASDLRSSIDVLKFYESLVVFSEGDPAKYNSVAVIRPAKR